jgi:hypothetical protein
MLDAAAKHTVVSSSPVNLLSATSAEQQPLVLRLSSLPLSVLLGIWSWKVEPLLHYQVAAWAFKDSDKELTNSIAISNLLQDIVAAGELAYSPSGACADLGVRLIVLHILTEAGVLEQATKSPDTWRLTPKGRQAVEVGCHLSDPQRPFSLRSVGYADMEMFELLVAMEKEVLGAS